MKEFTTADRLRQIMNDRQLKQVDILRLCKPFCEKYGVKLAKNDLSQYVNGKNEPGQDKLTILSLALGVEETWLMGYNSKATVEDCDGWDSEIDIITNETEADLLKKIQVKFGLKTFEAVQLFVKLNNEHQSNVIERMKTLLESSEYAIKKELSNGKAI